MSLPGVGVVATYDVARWGAALCTTLLAMWVNWRQGIPARVTLATAVVCVPAVIFASRALDALEYWDAHASMAERVSRGGSSIYGAWVAAFGLMCGIARCFGVPIRRFLDGGGPSMALGESLTRVGCLMAGCCHGSPAGGGLGVTFGPESMAFREHLAKGWLAAGATRSLPVHPVQLYGAVVMAIVCVLLARRLRHRSFEGEVFCWFLGVYGAWRLLVGRLRAESLLSMEAFSWGFVALGVGGLVAGTAFAFAEVQDGDESAR